MVAKDKRFHSSLAKTSHVAKQKKTRRAYKQKGSKELICFGKNSEGTDGLNPIETGFKSLESCHSSEDLAQDGSNEARRRRPSSCLLERSPAQRPFSRLPSLPRFARRGPARLLRADRNRGKAPCVGGGTMLGGWGYFQKSQIIADLCWILMDFDDFCPMVGVVQ